MKQQKIVPERFINQRVLQYITWPQYKYACSMASLTCVINYLYADEIGIQTPREVGGVLGVNPKRIRSASRARLQEWFETYLEKKGLDGYTDIGFDSDDVEGFNDNWDDDVNDALLARIDRTIRSKKKILVYSTSTHFLLVCGYYDANSDPDDVFIEEPDVRYYILADHSPTGLSRVLPRSVKRLLDSHSRTGDWNLYLPGPNPIKCKRWRDIWQDFLKKKHRFVLFERK